MLLKTFKRRVAIAEGAGIEDTIACSVINVLAMLGPKGTSDDETDGEESPKVVRRRKLEWLSDDVSLLMKTLETYEPRRRRRQFVTRGNSALRRRFRPNSVDEARAPVKKLPQNFYEKQWLQSLLPAARKGLGVKAVFPLPGLVGF
jgi:hypothetical protein